MITAQSLGPFAHGSIAFITSMYKASLLVAQD